MSDPLEQLDRFRSEVEGAPMLAADEIRRRGDRMRRRGNALKTGVAALAVAAVVVPLSLTGGHGGDDGPGFAKDPNTTPTPTPSATATAPALSRANLVTSSDVTFRKGLSWVQNYDEPASTQATFSVCDTSPLPDMAGFTAGFERDWNAHSDETGEPSDSYLDEVVAEFGSSGAASTAAATIKGWYDDCAPNGSTSYSPGTWNSVATGTGATAQQMVAHYGPAHAYPGSQFDVSGRADLKWYVDVSIIVDGGRVAVLTQNALLTGYDTTAITTTADDVPVAAQRLAGQSSGTTETTTATTTGGTTNSAGIPTTIPADFPIGKGWENEVPEGKDSIISPSHTRKVPELSACGTTLPWPAYEDRVTAGFHNPEDGRDRILTTYADTDAAAAATKSIVDLYRSCDSEPGQPAGYVSHYTVTQTTTSADSWHISRYYTYKGDPAIDIDDIHVIRVGLAVLILEHSNEGDRDSIPADFAAMNNEASEPLGELCVFSADRCP